MNELLKKMKENKTKSISIFSLVVLIVILVVLFRADVLSKEKLAFWDKDQSANILESDLIKGILEDIENRENKDESMKSSSKSEFSMTEVVDGVTYFKKVRVPVLASPELFDYSGEKTSGCGDEIVWIIKDIAPTRAPLSASINLLLTENKDYGFLPGNFIAKQEKLSLDNVVIEDSVAKISLNGEFTVDGVCDAPRQFIQLEENALQYSTVNAVQIYLNGELLR